VLLWQRILWSKSQLSTLYQIADFLLDKCFLYDIIYKPHIMGFKFRTKQIKKQAKPNFDLRGETYGVINSILLAKRFNHGICLDERLS